MGKDEMEVDIYADEIYWGVALRTDLGLHVVQELLELKIEFEVSYKFDQARYRELLQVNKTIGRCIQVYLVNGGYAGMKLSNFLIKCGVVKKGY
jgi:hypothetical protein